MSDLTGPQRRALAALADLSGDSNREVAPRQVAKALWPDSKAWTERTRRYGANHNGAVGGTMPMKAATMLWRLKDRGLARVLTDEVTRVDRWYVTDLGRRVLAGTDVPLPKPERTPEPAPVRTPKA